MRGGGRLAVNGEKKYNLKKEGCLNENASKVKADIFNGRNDFFDKDDIVQTRYEMLRCVEKDDCTVVDASDMYGVSRITFYKIKKLFDEQGIQGLLPGKKGPKKSHKLTPDVMKFLKDEIKAESSIKSVELADKIMHRFGYSVHPRTIEKALSARKKKRSETGND